MLLNNIIPIVFEKMDIISIKYLNDPSGALKWMTMKILHNTGRNFENHVL